MGGTLSLEDRLAIHELAARYGNVIDARDWEGLARVFTHDAVFETYAFGGDGDTRVDGLPAIQRMMDDSTTHPVTHHVTNVEVWEDGETVRLFFKVIGPGRKGRVGSADYQDVVRREAGGWRIAQHRATLRRPPGS